MRRTVVNEKTKLNITSMKHRPGGCYDEKGKCEL
jgi:hypothetical protein